jgi:hypothetical protein
VGESPDMDVVEVEESALDREWAELKVTSHDSENMKGLKVVDASCRGGVDIVVTETVTGGGVQ